MHRLPPVAQWKSGTTPSGAPQINKISLADQARPPSSMRSNYTPSFYRYSKYPPATTQGHNRLTHGSAPTEAHQGPNGTRSATRARPGEAADNARMHQGKPVGPQAPPPNHTSISREKVQWPSFGSSLGESDQDDDSSEGTMEENAGYGEPQREHLVGGPRIQVQKHSARRNLALGCDGRVYPHVDAVDCFDYRERADQSRMIRANEHPPARKQDMHLPMTKRDKHPPTRERYEYPSTTKEDAYPPTTEGDERWCCCVLM